MKKILALDIGGSSIKHGVLQEDGKILEKGKYSLEAVEELNDFYSALINIVNDYKSKYEIDRVGISSPGSVDSKTKIIHGLSALLYIHENNWVNELEEEIGLDISIENDANCAALAELWLGNAKGKKNVVSIVIGTGIGGSIIIDSKLVQGNSLYGGEFGYQLLQKENTIISISDQISTNALVVRVKKLIDVNSGIEVFELYDSGNEVVVKEVNAYFKDVALFIYNLVHAIDPEIVLIGGGISEREDIIKKIEQYYYEIQEAVQMSDLKLSISKCKFENSSNLIGAVYNALN